MHMAELSIQFTDDAPPKLFTAERIDERYDKEHWKRMERTTPNTAGNHAAPVVDWLFISGVGTVSIQPVADANGFRICRIPSFQRAEVYPVQFGFPPRLDADFEAEAEGMFLEASRAEVAAGHPPPDHDNNSLRHSILERLWAKHRTADEEKRWLQKLTGIGHRLVMGHYYQGGVFDHDLKHIHFRADFYTAGNDQPLSVLCATCEERVTSVTDASTLPVRTVENGIDFGVLAEQLGCKSSTLRDYRDKLGFGPIKKFTPAQVAEIVKFRQSLQLRPHLKVQNRTRRGHSPRPRRN